MFLFPNLDDEINVYDKRQGNGFFSVIGTEPIICKYRKGDVLKVLLYEKPLLKSYQLLNILHVSVENYVIIDIEGPYSSIPKIIWTININFATNHCIGGGTERIENLDQKIRDIKLNKLLYGKR